MSTSKQLLIVDDDQEIRELLNEYLTRAGFEVLTAAEGNEMRKQLAQHNPDLIILDIMMPGDDGLPSASRSVATPGAHHHADRRLRRSGPGDRPRTRSR